MFRPVSGRNPTGRCYS